MYIRAGGRAYACAAAGHDKFGRGQNFARERALNGKVGDDDSVARILTPGLEELAGESGLHHAGRRHNDARARTLEVPCAPELTHVLELERVRPLHANANVTYLAHAMQWFQITAVIEVPSSASERLLNAVISKRLVDSPEMPA